MANEHVVESIRAIAAKEAVELAKLHKELSEAFDVVQAKMREIQAKEGKLRDSCLFLSEHVKEDPFEAFGFPALKGGSTLSKITIDPRGV